MPAIWQRSRSEEGDGDMKPVDFRNAAWADIEDRLSGLRRAVWEGLRTASGPRTARQLASELGLDILTVAPRLTELGQMGFARLAPETEQKGRRGVYEAVGITAAREAFEAMRAEARGQFRQGDLRLTA